MKKTKIIPAAVLCAVTSVMGCRYNGGQQDPAHDDNIVIQPVNAAPTPAPEPAQTPATTPTPAPEPAPVPTRVDDDNPELVRTRAENAELRRQLSAAGVAPVASPTNPVAAAPTDEPAAEPEGTMVVLGGLVTKPSYAAAGVLFREYEITLPLLRGFDLWPGNKPTEDYVAVSFSDPTTVVHSLTYNAIRDTTSDSGKVAVDSLGFVEEQTVRPRQMLVQGQRTRVIPFVQPGRPEIWNFSFCPIPEDVKETLISREVNWAVWAMTNKGPTRIGSLSFSQDTISLNTGTPVSLNSRENGRDREGKMTHAWQMRPTP